MRISIVTLTMSITLFFNAAYLFALPVSSNDLWQDATVTDASSVHYATGSNHNGLFDGNEGYYGVESGNSIFADGLSATTNWVEWQTTQIITVQSINITTYHDFDERNINYRGINEIRLYYDNGSEWEQFYTWTFSDPNNDLHYGGGPAHQLSPDPHDMNRSYLELVADLGLPVTAQRFRGEFDSYNTNFGGPRLVELDAYETLIIPEPLSITLLLFGLLAILRRYRKA